jgi:hypothetical protein
MASPKRYSRPDTSLDLESSKGRLMLLLLKIYDFLFGCNHKKLTRVFTIDRRTYRVCCACGAKFNYSLEHMALEQQAGRSGAVAASLRMARTAGRFLFSWTHRVPERYSAPAAQGPEIRSG